MSLHHDAPGRRGLVLQEPFLFELGSPGNQGIDLPVSDVPAQRLEDSLPAAWLRSEVEDFPCLSEPEVVRHFTRLSTWNYSLDGGFYPLGSCTMKYNPKLNEKAAALEGFAGLHPYQPDEDSQGILQLLHELEQDLVEISGMDYACLHPAAGSHGELLGIMLIRAYHQARGDHKRTKVLIPDSAHGTNPSSAAICSLEAVELSSGPDGLIDLERLSQLMTDEVAAIMITNPNTCGLFETRIKEVCELVHARGGLVYFDGANMNALVGKARPGDMGADVLHFNTHKTFSTPHGGGGPGAGPIGIKAILEPFLPKPVIKKSAKGFGWEWNRPQSIGQIRSFYGNIGVLIRAYAYIRTMGPTHLREMTETAVLNANYLKHRLKERFHLPFPEKPCMHEVLVTDQNWEGQGPSTMDMAKGLIDKGFHPPTVYFPLVTKGALLIEPTETESRLTLDRFADALLELSHADAEALHHAPLNTYVQRVDEVAAARKPILCWQKNLED